MAKFFSVNVKDLQNHAQYCEKCNKLLTEIVEHMEERESHLYKVQDIGFR